MAGPDTAGERITIDGRVFDASGDPVPDALVEIWQANGAGRYRHPEDLCNELAIDRHFTGFGRVPTDSTGGFHFETIRPGRVPGPGNSLQAPHIAVGVLGRGLLRRLVTRLYFADVAANDEDPILALVPHDRRASLIAARALDEGDAVGIAAPAPAAYRFDIHLQGPSETVFFDV